MNKVVKAAAIAAMTLGVSAGGAMATSLAPGASSFSEVWSTDGAGMDSGGFDLTVAAGSVATVSYTIEDCCIVGDTFDALINGALTAWDSEGFTGGGGHWVGTLTTVLASGFHTFDAIIDASGSGGAVPAGADVDFDVSVAPVPLPAGGLLLIGGLGGLAALRRKKKKA